jgi:hypothetical protein
MRSPLIIFVTLIALLGRFCAGVMAPGGDLCLCLWNAESCHSIHDRSHDHSAASLQSHDDECDEQAGSSSKQPSACDICTESCPHHVQIAQASPAQLRLTTVPVSGHANVNSQVDAAMPPNLSIGLPRPDRKFGPHAIERPPDPRWRLRSVILQV